MYQVSVPTLIKLAWPYVASVLEPVVPTPAQIKVTLPVLIVVVELAITRIAVPTGNATLALVGIVNVPDP